MILEEIIIKAPELIEAGQKLEPTNDPLALLKLFGIYFGIFAIVIPTTVATLSALNSTIATTKEHFLPKKSNEEYSQTELFPEPELSYGKRWIKNFGRYFEGMGLCRPYLK